MENPISTPHEKKTWYKLLTICENDLPLTKIIFLTSTLLWKQNCSPFKTCMRETYFFNIKWGPPISSPLLASAKCTNTSGHFIQYNSGDFHCVIYIPAVMSPWALVSMTGPQAEFTKVIKTVKTARNLGEIKREATATQHQSQTQSWRETHDVTAR